MSDSDMAQALQFDSILMYGGTLFNFFFILFASYFYTLVYIAHYLVTVYFIMVVVVHVSSELHYIKNGSLKRPPKTQYCLWIWLAWLIYGLIYHDVTLDTLNEAVGTIQSVILFGIVICTYWPVTNTIYISTLLLCGFGLIILIPNSDSIAFNMTTYLLITKISFFLLLYTFISFIQYFSKFKKGRDIESHKIHDPRDESYIREKIEVHSITIQTSWVLFSSRYIMIFFFIQMAIITPILINNLRSYSSFIRKTETKHNIDDFVIEAKQQKGKIPSHNFEEVLTEPQKRTNGISTNNYNNTRVQSERRQQAPIIKTVNTNQSKTQNNAMLDKIAMEVGMVKPDPAFRNLVVHRGNGGLILIKNSEENNK